MMEDNKEKTMNDEEAIEKLKEIIKNDRRATDCYISVTISNKERREEVQSIETVLNIIEKQKEEIEKLRKNNKNLLRKLRNRVKEVKKLEKYSLYKKEFATLNKQLKEKDLEITSLKMEHDYDVKMIDEMAEYIKEPYQVITIGSRKPKIEIIKEYFENKVKESK